MIIWEHRIDKMPRYLPKCASVLEHTFPPCNSIIVKLWKLPLWDWLSPPTCGLCVGQIPGLAPQLPLLFLVRKEPITVPGIVDGNC